MSKKELNENQLEEVAGGYVFYNDAKNFPFEVREDHSGYVIGRYSTLDEAKQAARDGKYSVKELTPYELENLRLDSETPDFPSAFDAKG